MFTRLINNLNLRRSYSITTNNHPIFLNWKNNPIFLNWKNNLGAIDYVGDTIVHHLAINPDKDIDLCTNVLTELVYQNKTNLLFKRNISGDAPIELAVLFNNTQFIEMTKQICNEPTIENIEKMDNIDYYMSLTDCPKLLSLLYTNNPTTKE